MLTALNQWRPYRPSNALRHRKGAALVEFAVCLPVLVLIVLGSIEATSAVFVRQSLVVAAYEGVREAVRRDGTLADANSRARSVLDQRKVNSAQISFTPSDLSQVKRGDEITVEIVAGMKENSPFFGKILSNRTVRVSTTMVRE